MSFLKEDLSAIASLVRSDSATSVAAKGGRRYERTKANQFDIIHLFDSKSMTPHDGITVAVFDGDNGVLHLMNANESLQPEDMTGLAPIKAISNYAKNKNLAISNAALRILGPMYPEHEFETTETPQTHRIAEYLYLKGYRKRNADISSLWRYVASAHLTDEIKPNPPVSALYSLNDWAVQYIQRISDDEAIFFILNDIYAIRKELLEIELDESNHIHKLHQIKKIMTGVEGKVRVCYLLPNKLSEAKYVSASRIVKACDMAEAAALSRLRGSANVKEPQNDAITPQNIVRLQLAEDHTVIYEAPLEKPKKQGRMPVVIDDDLKAQMPSGFASPDRTPKSRRRGYSKTPKMRTTKHDDETLQKRKGYGPLGGISEYKKSGAAKLTPEEIEKKKTSRDETAQKFKLIDDL